MLIKNLTKREKYIAIAAATFISGAVIYNFMIDPLAGHWRNANDEIKAKAGALKKDAKILSMHKGIESDYAKFSRYVKSTANEEEAIADILTYIETVSRSDSCLIVNIKPVGTKNMGAYKEVLIDVAAEASIEQFAKFLYDIENSTNMILEVKRFTLNSKSAPGMLKGTFLISKISMD